MQNMRLNTRKREKNVCCFGNCAYICALKTRMGYA